MKRRYYQHQPTQVDRLVRLFGSQANLIRAMEKAGHKIHRASVAQWKKPRSKGGGGGRIPSYRIDEIKRAARLAGIFVTERTFWDGEI